MAYKVFREIEVGGRNSIWQRERKEKNNIDCQTKLVLNSKWSPGGQGRPCLSQLGLGSSSGCSAWLRGLVPIHSLAK